MTEDLEQRTTFRDIIMTRSTHLNCGIDSGIIEDVCIDGLVSMRDPFFAHGSVFRHVTLKGIIDRISLRSQPVAAVERPSLAQRFRRAVDEYYQDVDWALDIGEAEFEDVLILGIPADLIRRDPSTQGIVRSQMVSLESLDGLAWLGVEFRTMLGLFIRSGYASGVLVVPKRSGKRARLEEELNRLRAEGIVERD